MLRRKPLLGRALERFVFAAAVDCEILVQRKNIRSSKLVRQTNQAGIRKIKLHWTLRDTK